MRYALAALMLCFGWSAPTPGWAQTSGVCCGKQVELSKKGAGLVRSRPACFDCKEYVESGAKSWEEYACGKVRAMGPMGRVRFATECGVVVECPAGAGGVNVREGIVKQLRDQGASCAVCPLLGQSLNCPAQAEINRLIAEAETRLNGIEQMHKSAAAVRVPCMSHAQILRDVCVTARKPEYDECLKKRPATTCEREQDAQCPSAQVACGAELKRENQLNWQRMILTQDIAELKKLDFSCPGADGQCVQVSHNLGYSQIADLHEKLCPSGLRAQFRYIFNATTVQPIGRVFVQCS
jgi:hypothetical protein